MGFTDKHWLPSEEELTVEEIPLSSPAFKTAAFHMGRACYDQSKEFMLCNDELKDPRKCLNEGKELTACGMSFLRNLKKHCAEEFDAHWRCVELKSPQLAPMRCRKSQAIYDKCVLENLNVERPYIGFFSRPHMHDTARPKPPPKVNTYSDVPAMLPEDYPRPESKYRTRFFFYD